MLHQATPWHQSPIQVHDPLLRAFGWARTSRALAIELKIHSNQRNRWPLAQQLAMNDLESGLDGDNDRK